MARRDSSTRARASGGEFGLIAKIRAAVAAEGRGRGVVVGIGDDCAVVEMPAAARTKGGRRAAGASKTRGGASAPRPRLVLTTDTMVEGVHFRREWLTAKELGVRAWRAAASDIGAMGAKPLWCLLSLELPVERETLREKDTLALIRGLAGQTRRDGAALVGGNVTGGEQLSIAVTVLGEPAGAPLLRSGARPRDLVFVTGSFGGAAAGWRVLAAASEQGPRAIRAERASSAAWRQPPSRLAFAAEIARRGLAHSMIDVSDGLLQDLGHLAEESRVAIRLDVATVPVHRAAKALEKALCDEGLLRRLDAGASRGAASRRDGARDRRSSSRSVPLAFSLELALGGGEDYELALTAPPSSWPAIERVAAATGTPLMPIGVVERGAPAVTDSDGRAFLLESRGFDHLRRNASRTT